MSVAIPEILRPSSFKFSLPLIQQLAPADRWLIARTFYTKCRAIIALGSEDVA